MVVHAVPCNPNTLGGRVRRITSFSPAEQFSHLNEAPKVSIKHKGMGVELSVRPRLQLHPSLCPEPLMDELLPRVHIRTSSLQSPDRGEAALSTCLEALHRPPSLIISLMSCIKRKKSLFETSQKVTHKDRLTRVPCRARAPAGALLGRLTHLPVPEVEQQPGQHGRHTMPAQGRRHRPQALLVLPITPVFSVLCPRSSLPWLWQRSREQLSRVESGC